MKEKAFQRNCHMHEALVSYLYGEISPEEAARFQEHLSNCAICRDELVAFERVRSALGAWRLDQLPPLQIAHSKARRRPALQMMPFWMKGLGAAMAAILLLAIMGTELHIGRDGFTLRMNILSRSRFGPSEEEIRAMVSAMIAESELRHKEELARLESELQNAHSADLAKISANIREQREKLRALERDIDRHAGLDLTELLFREAAFRSGSGR
jgi:hypothetical protein